MIYRGRKVLDFMLLPAYNSPAMGANKDSERAKKLLRFGLILALVGAGLATLVSLLSCVINIQSPPNLEMKFLVYSWILHWITVTVARSWALIGGVLLIFDSMILTALVLLEFSSRSLDVPQVSIFFLPAIVLLFISGILFILSSRKTRESKDIKSSNRLLFDIMLIIG